MKTNYLLMVFFCWIITGLQAQQIMELEGTMSRGVKNGFYMEISGIEKDDVEDLWKDYLEKFAKKVKEDNDEFYTEECRVPAINGSAELTIYSTIEEGIGMVTLYTWVDLGGVFLNTEDHPTQIEGMEYFMYDFYVIARKKAIEKMLEKEREILKDLDKDLNKMIDKNDDYYKEIEEAQEKIRKMELEIEKNLGEQDDKRVEIQQQQAKIEALIKKLNEVGKEGKPTY